MPITHPGHVIPTPGPVSMETSWDTAGTEKKREALLEWLVCCRLVWTEPGHRGRCCGLMLEALGSDALVGDEGESSCYVIRMGFCRTSRMSEEKYTANGNHVTQLSVPVCARV